MTSKNNITIETEKKFDKLMQEASQLGNSFSDKGLEKKLEEQINIKGNFTSSSDMDDCDYDEINLQKKI